MKIWITLCSLAVVLSACNAPETSLPNSPGTEVVRDESVPIIPSMPEIVKAKTVALVYEGPGACPEDCAKAAADTAKLAGFTPKMVGPNALTSSSTPEQIAALFQDAAIWVQPGGKSTKAYEAITPTLREALIAFVKNGGGYVGFCAGAFITTDEIGTTGKKGFGIFPGRTAPLGTGSHFETVNWEGKTRGIYFEGGPYMYNMPPSVEVTAVYDDGKTIASARTTFGNGRVYITGPHPEAPEWWLENEDADGSDRDLAIGMMKWAAQQ